MPFQSASAPGAPTAVPPVRFLLSAFDRGSLAALLLALLCVLTGTGFSVAAPILLARLVDTLTVSRGGAIWLIVAYTSCLGLARLAGEGKAWLHGRAEQDILRNLSKSAAARIFALPAIGFHGKSSGELLQTLENGLQGYRLFLQHGVFTLVPGLLEMLVIGAVLLVYLDGVFLLVFILCALLYAAVFFYGARAVLRVSREVSSARIEATASLADSLLNIETIKAFSGESVMTARLDARLLKTRDAWRGFHTARVRSGILIALIFSAGMAAVLWLSQDRIASGVMTPGEIVLVASYMLQIVRPMELLGFAARDLGQASAFTRRLSAVLNQPPEQAPEKDTDTPAGGMAIRLEQVSCRAGGDVPVLEQVSFDIPAGIKLGIVGPSGSGKSTLLRLLLRFQDAEEGRILMDGKEVNTIAPGMLRQQIAYVPQAPGLFNDTLAFNVGFPDADLTPSELEEILHDLRLGNLVSRMALAGERGAALSGGERQRIAIARALKRKPRLILADEPTAALDADTESAVLERLRNAHPEATLILVSHRLKAIRDMDCILVLAGGRIAEAGTHEDLFAEDGLYAKLWRHQEQG